jgi:hypothetical protein
MSSQEKVGKKSNFGLF